MHRKCTSCANGWEEDPSICLECDPETLNFYIPDREQMIIYLQDKLEAADLWGQLAEEAAELAQAALKMQRVLTGRNMPRKTEEECIKAVTEEHADVALCFRLLNWNDKAERKQVQEEKLHRWFNSICEIETRIAQDDNPG